MAATTVGFGLTEEQGKKVNEFFAAYALPGEKKSDTFLRLCDTAAQAAADLELREAGLDLKGFDLAIASLRAIFAAQVAVRRQLEEGRVAERETLNAEWRKTVAGLQGEILRLKDEVAEYKATADDLRKENTKLTDRLSKAESLFEMKKELTDAQLELAVSKATVALEYRVKSLTELLVAHGIELPV